MADALYISEIFCSVQGEGLLTGQPSVFVRTSGCNLRCRWCDTPYTSWAAEGTNRPLAEVLAEVARHEAVRHVVVTGGEPLIAKGVDALVAALHDAGHHVTVETAGTVFRDLPVDLWSISPKLADSTPTDDAAGWRARHEARRHRPEVVRAMMASAPYQLKFVVTSPADLDEIEALTAEVGADRDRVLLMPQGTTVEALDACAAWLVPLCVGRGYRFCDRTHVRLFGNTPGT